MIKEFQTISTFKSYVSNLPTLQLTIDTSINKTFTILRLNKGTAPENIRINWGDDTITTYDDLLKDNINNSYSHTYTDNKIYTIKMSGDVKEHDTWGVCFQAQKSLKFVMGNIFMYHSGPATAESPASQGRFFNNCSNLIEIDKDIFKMCINLKQFFCSFNACTSLQSLPEGLLDHMPDVTNMTSAFLDMTKLTTIPITLFDKNTKIINFLNCFMNCTNLSSEVPDIWNKTKWPNVTKATTCFRSCNKIANYASIPAGWK